MDVRREGMNVNTLSYLDRARAWSRTLEDREAKRLGMHINKAREVVARRIGVAPGTLENLRKNRLKTIAAHVFERIRSAIDRELMAEVGRLENELQIIRASGHDAGPVDYQAVLADLEKVKAAVRSRR